MIRGITIHIPALTDLLAYLREQDRIRAAQDALGKRIEETTAKVNSFYPDPEAEPPKG